MTNLAHEAWFKDPALKRVFALLNADGGEGRVVGGGAQQPDGACCQRYRYGDDADARVVIERARAAGIKAVPTGVEHGTVTLVIDGKPFEVTTLRTDVETDGRRAKVAFSTDWQTDAERRDLTINALYVDAARARSSIWSAGLPISRSATSASSAMPRRGLPRTICASCGSSGSLPITVPGGRMPTGCGPVRRRARSCRHCRPNGYGRSCASCCPPRIRAGRCLWMRQVGSLTEILPETEKWGIDAIPALVATEQALGWRPDPLATACRDRAAGCGASGENGSKAEARECRGGFLKAWAMRRRQRRDVVGRFRPACSTASGTEGIVAAQAGARGGTRQGGGRFEGNGAFGAARQAARSCRDVEEAAFPFNGSDVMAAGVPAGRQHRRDAVGRWKISGSTRISSADRAALLARLADLVK
jgi:poly(A) polymerase